MEIGVYITKKAFRSVIVEGIFEYKKLRFHYTLKLYKQQVYRFFRKFYK
jgi:hypothetical protein